MTDRPIIFSTPMVRALLDGRKTQTRRIISADIPDGHFVDHCHFCASGWGLWERGPWAGGGRCTCREVKGIRFREGDRLYVREAWCRCAEAEGRSLYRADGEHVVQDDGDGFTATNRDGSERSPWRPSIHMPRWASRLTLVVTDVRVERLQDISEADAIAEGGTPLHAGWWSHADGQAGVTAKASFGVLWNSINGPEAWAANPWVAAVSFTVHRANIDALDLEAAA